MPIQPGDIIGAFEILEELGRGGMATVYRARQRSMGREVAVKVLPEQFLHDANFLTRFNTEARVIASLEHRSILPVYDFGEAGGTPYIVMRLMPHGSLRARLHSGPLPPAEVARLVTQVAEALDYAHTRGVIHRDLKPDNVLLDAQGHAYLSDFGIAKVLEASAQTSGARLIGTPNYMAPEQAQGARPSPATDIYALGAMAFEMLTGQPPFQADEFLAVLYKHVNEPVPRLRALNAALPAGLQAVLERALAKDPAARYPTARALAADLEQAVGGAAALPTVTAGPASVAAGPTIYETPAPSAPVAAPGPAQAATPAPVPAPAQKRRTPGPTLALALGIGGCLALLAIAALAYSSGAFGGLLPAPSASPAPTRTRLPPTRTRPPAPTATSAPGGGASAVLRVGGQLPLTGPLAALGQEAANGAQLAFTTYADTLRAQGYAVEYALADNQSSLEQAAALADQFVRDAGTLCAVGPLASPAALAAGEIYAQGGLAMISPGSTAPAFTERGWVSVFRLAGRADVEARVALRFAREVLQAGSVYVVFDDSGFGEENALFFAFALEAAGQETLGQDGPLGPGTYADSIGALSAAAPDVVYFSGQPDTARQYILAARAAGVTAPFIGPAAIGWPALAAPGLGAVYYVTDTVAARHFPNTAQFAPDYEAAYGAPASGFTVHAYDAMSACLDAIRRAAALAGGVPSRAQVVQALHETDLKGLLGDVRFTEGGDLVAAPYFIVEVTATSADDWASNPVIGPYYQ
jgi:serine/threonine-protein kinase